MTRPRGPHRPLGQRRPRPEGARTTDRTRVGWEGETWNWVDPAWSSVLRPLALGEPRARGDLVAQILPSLRATGVGVLEPSRLFFKNPIRAF